ncbi:MAG: helix-turn-helix transcriptional regulator, partial [Tidjanibacter sp.]|nr:helix-turn-helix transcriptional regulator [Tidjanibacter sp.]
MRTRLLQLIETEGLTKQQFAQKLSISPAAVTHILSGRNSPSLEIIAKIAATFPQCNLRWLILGELPMLINNTAEADMAIESTPETIL